MSWKRVGMANLNWKRARDPKPTEAAIGEGFVRKNGVVTPVLPKASLAIRAAAAEKKWMRAQRLKIGRKGYISHKTKLAPKEKPAG